MPTCYNIVLPLIIILLPTDTLNLSFTPLYLICFFSYYEAISLKYNLIKLLYSFYLYSEVLSIKDNIKIEFTNLQTITIRGYFKRLYASYIPLIRLIEGIITRNAITKDSKISSLDEIAIKDKRATL